MNITFDLENQNTKCVMAICEPSNSKYIGATLNDDDHNIQLVKSKKRVAIPVNIITGNITKIEAEMIASLNEFDGQLYIFSAPINDCTEAIGMFKGREISRWQELCETTAA
jgi:hypothetical protein